MVHDGASEELSQAIAEARERGRKMIEQIFEQDDMLDLAGLKRKLSVEDESVIEKMVEDHALLKLDHDGANKFPSWQIVDGRTLEILPRLFEELEDPWAVYRFLVSHHNAMGCSGLGAARDPKKWKMMFSHIEGKKMGVFE